MKLLTKINLILVLLFGIAGLIISQIAYSFLIDDARSKVLEQAELMMASANAVREYTVSDLAPLLEKNPQHHIRFLAETVPAFGAITTFDKLRQNYPEYTYREATLNPTNLEHRAADWEADLIEFMRNHPEQKKIWRERETPMGPSMYLASPLRAQMPCLECHSKPAAAPAAMIATYGSEHGFGWKPDSIVAAQIVSVPMSVPVRNAKRAFHVLIVWLIITLMAIIATLDAAVYFIVIRPLKLVSDTADRVSMGEMNTPSLPVKGKDEIAAVTASFNRMQLSLIKAFKMLG